MRLELLTEALRVLDKDPTDLFERTAPSAVGTPRESAVDGLCGSMSPMLFASGEEEEIPLAEFLAGVDTTDVERRYGTFCWTHNQRLTDAWCFVAGV